MSLKKEYLIKSLLFIVVFAILLVLASVFDLQISHLLASNDLAQSTYYSTNIFGRFFEYIGSFPIFVFGAFACLVLMHYFYKYKSYGKYLSLLMIVILVVVFEYLIHDTLKYIFRNHNIEEFLDNIVLTISVWVISFLISVICIILYRKVDYEKNKKLIRYSIVIALTCSFYLIVSLIKGPIGRMRYRAMNLINDFSYFTPWYQVSEAKNMLQNVDIPSDGFKSFPSGHTFSAGVSYVLICLPYVYEKFNNRKWKIIWYIIPVLYTGIVALSRIVVGAHYFSDVLIGGSLAYIGAELFKYIFLVRNKNNQLI